MLLKSQTTINTEQVISILEFQLSQAKKRLSELTEADTKFESVVAELEALLSQHPDYQSVVSARLSRLQPTPKPTLSPVRIEIESVEEEEVEEQTPDTAIDTEDIENWPIPFPTTEELKEKMLACKCKPELDALKAEIGEFKAIEVLEGLSLLQKNYIKTVENLKSPPKGVFIGVGTKLKYTDSNGKSHNAKGIGHYLYGEPLQDSERAILVDGATKPIVVKRTQLKPFAAKDQGYLDETDLQKLENFLTQPQQQLQQDDDEEPDATTLAALQFTGLAEIPKPQTVSQTGKQPDSQASEPSVEQPALPLTVEQPQPKQLPPTPTPALEYIKQEILKVNATLDFSYETYIDITYLNIYHGDSLLGFFEDGVGGLWESAQNLSFHGFSSDKIDKITEKAEAIAEEVDSKKA